MEKNSLTLEEIQQVIGQLVLEIHSRDKQARQLITSLTEKLKSPQEKINDSTQ